MAGHSKWANTKHRKIIKDIKRSKIFTKIIRELVTASRLGGNNPASNPRLRTAINKAMLNNMTRDTLNRAIARGTSNENGIKTKNATYEGYGPGGTAVIVKCLSDNLNRTVAEVRYAFNRYGGSLSTDGSVKYLFVKRGIFVFNIAEQNNILDVISRIDIEDITIHDNNTINIHITEEKMNEARNVFREMALKAIDIKVNITPLTRVIVNTENKEKLLKLIKLLNNYEDVSKVYHNGDILNVTI